VTERCVEKASDEDFYRRVAKDFERQPSVIESQDGAIPRRNAAVVPASGRSWPAFATAELPLLSGEDRRRAPRGPNGRTRRSHVDRAFNEADISGPIFNLREGDGQWIADVSQSFL
jgi:hypothetical protein